MDSEIDELLEKMEEENGGKIEFKTYCRLVGFSDGTPLDTGGLLYIVAHKIVFEDFEKQPGLLDMFGRGKKQKYQKFKTYRLVDEVAGFRCVKAGDVARVLKQKADPARIPEATGISKMFAQILTEMRFKDGSCWYMELLSDKELKDYMKEHTA